MNGFMSVVDKWDECMYGCGGGYMGVVGGVIRPVRGGG